MRQDRKPMMWLVRWMRWMMMLCATALIAGCAATSGNYCDIAAPIWWESAEELAQTPDGVVRQVVRHNETWQRVCGR